MQVGTSTEATSRGATSSGLPDGASFEERASLVSGADRTSSAFCGASPMSLGGDVSLVSDRNDASDDASRSAAPKPSKL
jgi:hypothetical protein